MPVKRVTAFVHGFNLYHALDRLGLHHLKWVDLRAFCTQFAPTPDHILTNVFYFSAFATWRPAAYRRHREYIQALRVAGVTPVMGKFKRRTRQCGNCGHQWLHHEEKETDVNIALYLVRAAYVNSYDTAMLISGDSDPVPAVKMVRADFPQKQVRVIAPLGRPYSTDLYNAAGGTKYCRKMNTVHLERLLFPRDVFDAEGRVAASRPAEYDVPGSKY